MTKHPEGVQIDGFGRDYFCVGFGGIHTPDNYRGHGQEFQYLSDALMWAGFRPIDNNKWVFGEPK